MVETFFRSENKDQAVCSGFQQITLILYTSEWRFLFSNQITGLLSLLQSEG